MRAGKVGGVKPLYVVGGRQREHRSMLDLSDSWYGYGSGVIVRLDDAGARVVLEYESKPGTCAPDDPVLFKSASRRGNHLYCCTQTEIVVFELPSFREMRHVSLPQFNDVHHVVPTETGTLLVANSGLECVLEVGPDDEIINEWNVLGETSAIEPGVDFRHGVNLKPHRAHPNHVCFVGDEPWVTRFERKDAVSLLDPSRRIDLGGERVHDGVVRDGSVWFTTVDGELVVADPVSLEVTERFRLRRHGSDELLGWCRGLHFADDHVWVGFSRIRATKLRQTVSWVRNRGTAQAPSRIACYRLADMTLVSEIDLEPSGVNGVFSILPGYRG